ncbi:MAG: hypothetical protein F4166_01255 [Gammaproteobacteria bacterium]|nr:hypothetical protein [Gammaproteobacteria bacterium]
MKEVWLHKIGVDVCRLRREDIKIVCQEPQSSKPTETHTANQQTEPERSSHTTPNTKGLKDDLFSQSKGTVPKVSIRNTKNQTIESATNVKKSFRICVYTTSEFSILYDHTLSLKNELIQDLAQVLQLCRTNKPKVPKGETSIFNWPPESSPTLPTTAIDDIKSAARALMAFLTENARQLQTLLIMGETANSILVDKVEKDFDVYRVLEIHSQSGWKKKLWTELQR